MSSQDVLRQQSAFQAFGDGRDPDVSAAVAAAPTSRKSSTSRGRKRKAQQPQQYDPQQEHFQAASHQHQHEISALSRAKKGSRGLQQQQQHPSPAAPSQADLFMQHPHQAGAAALPWRANPAAAAQGVPQNYPPPMYQLPPHMSTDANGHVQLDMNGMPLMNRLSTHSHVGMPLMPSGAPNMSAVVPLSEIHGGPPPQAQHPQQPPPRPPASGSRSKGGSRSVKPKGANSSAAIAHAQVQAGHLGGVHAFGGSLPQQPVPVTSETAKKRTKKAKVQQPAEETAVIQGQQGYGVVSSMGVPMMSLQGMNQLHMVPHLQPSQQGQPGAPAPGPQKRSRGRPKGKSSRIRPDGTKLKQKPAEVKSILEDAFARSYMGRTPKGDDLLDIVNSTGLTKYEIQSWFGGRRFRLKKRAAEGPKAPGAKRATKDHAGDQAELEAKAHENEILRNGMASAGTTLGDIFGAQQQHQRVVPEGAGDGSRASSAGRSRKAKSGTLKSKRAAQTATQSVSAYGRMGTQPLPMHGMMPSDHVRTSHVGSQLPNGNHGSHPAQPPSHAHPHYHAHHNHQALLYNPSAGLDGTPMNALYHANGNVATAVAGAPADMSKVQHLDPNLQLSNGTHPKPAQHMAHHSPHVAPQQPSHTQVMPSNYLGSDGRYQRHQVAQPMNGVLGESEMPSSVHPFYHSWVTHNPSSQQVLVPTGGKMVDLYDGSGMISL